MKKTFRINQLLDFYEALLSGKQADVMDLYYKEDYSLNEIAEILSISKQAVHDNLKRAESNLEEFEQKLKLSELQSKKDENLKEVSHLIQSLYSYSQEPKFTETLEELESILSLKEGRDDI